MRNCDENGKSGSGEHKEEEKIFVALLSYFLTRPYIRAGLFSMLMNLWRNFLVTKPTRCTNFSNLFWNETLHVSGSFSVHH
jgi:hypothetical protein